MNTASRLEDIFLGALDQATPEACAAYLEAACRGDAELRRQVERLLAAHPRAAGFLEQPARETGAFAPESEGRADGPVTIGYQPDWHAGAIIAGKYKLLQKIGEGGMGSVWMADQLEPVKRRVAVKLIRTERDGSRTILSRFEAERQAIALMDHPHIARLLDAGTTGHAGDAVSGEPSDQCEATSGLRPDARQGTPFFVMELVKGIPLHEYCDQHRLSIADRLCLFMQICSAVQHAHQKGIIHRDLKPSNILVEAHDDKPVPKVIDFGLAKALSGQPLTEHTLFTEFGTVAGTPLYMAPEQAKFNAIDIDTRADIYALGVILYELLTGTTPIERKQLRKEAFDEILRLIRESDPPTPSKRLSSSDSKPSVAANRQSEPIRSARAAIRVGCIQFRLGRSGETAAAFRRSVAAYAKLAAEFPAVPEYPLGLASSHSNLGTALQHLGNLTRAEGEHGKALAILEQTARAFPKSLAYRRALAAVHMNLAAALTDLGKHAEAVQQNRKALATQEKLAADFPDVLAYRETLAQIHNNQGTLFHWQGTLTGAQRHYRQALAVCESLVARCPAVPQYRDILASSQSNLGRLLDNVGMQREGEERLRQALQMQIKLVAEYPAVPAYRLHLANVHNNLALMLVRRAKLSEALEEHRRAQAIYDKLATDFPGVPEYRHRLATSHRNLGIVLAGLHRHAEAEQHYGKAIAILDNLVSEFPGVPEYRMQKAKCYENRGGLLKDVGEPRQAEIHFRRALDIKEKLVADFSLVPAYRHELAIGQTDMAVVLGSIGNRREAQKLFCSAQAIEEKLARTFPAVPSYRQQLAASCNDFGNLLARDEKYQEAETQYRQALRIMQELAKEFPDVVEHQKRLAIMHTNLGHVLEPLGKPLQAEQHYRTGLTIQQSLATRFPAVAEYAWLLAVTHHSLAGLMHRLRKDAEAEKHYRQALIIQEKLVAAFTLVQLYQVTLGGSYCNFGILMHDRGRPIQGLEWFDKAIRTLTPVYERNGRLMVAKKYLRNSHRGRALAYDRLQKYAVAVKDWDRVVELSPEQEQAGDRAARATSRLNAGQVDEALAEVAELARSSNWTAAQWYDFACVYAVASSRTRDRNLPYADRSMELLKKAVTAGFRNAAHMKKDKDLDSLRTRQDFKELIDELEKTPPARPK
jgi:serine/threonine protein kinase/Tfp pilus assembly protein PilF